MPYNADRNLTHNPKIQRPSKGSAEEPDYCESMICNGKCGRPTRPAKRIYKNPT